MYTCFLVFKYILVLVSTSTAVKRSSRVFLRFSRFPRRLIAKMAQGLLYMLEWSSEDISALHASLHVHSFCYGAVRAVRSSRHRMGTLQEFGRRVLSFSQSKVQTRSIVDEVHCALQQITIMVVATPCGLTGCASPTAWCQTTASTPRCTSTGRKRAPRNK